MTTGTSFWQKIGLHDWFLKKGASVQEKINIALTPEDIYKYIISEFHNSIDALSFADRIVFFHEFIICFNAEDYGEFINNKKGIFGLIIQESVKAFYVILRNYREQGKIVEPSGNKWVFRFVSHPDYARGDKSFIGKLLPGNLTQKNDNLRITYIPRQTGLSETIDIHGEILKDFTFYSDGYYEIPYRDDLLEDKRTLSKKAEKLIARLEAIIPDKEFAGKKIEFLMKDMEIIISGKDEMRKDAFIFIIPSDWVGSPHLQIKYNQSDGKFYVCSFGEKTILNEMEIPVSDVNAPSWSELPLNSKLVLNGIVGVNFFKS